MSNAKSNHHPDGHAAGAMPRKPHARPHRARRAARPTALPAERVAKTLGMSADRFNRLLPDLYRRGFPEPDPATGCFDRGAVNLWRRARNSDFARAATVSDITNRLRGLGFNEP